MFYKTLLSMVSVLIFCQTAHASISRCTPSENSCAAYQCLEEEKSCGESAYLKSFGQPSCQKYLDIQNEVSNSLQIWFRKVRYCLQEKLIESSNLNCSKLSQLGFDSHLTCYVETGFCELSYEDRIEVATTMWRSFFHKEARDAGRAVLKSCALRYQEHFVLIFKQRLDPELQYQMK